MEPDQEEVFRQKQLAFIGKVAVGYAEKMEALLADIEASAGRLGDLLGQTGPWREEDLEGFGPILSTIDRHRKFLARKSRHLERFARRMGTPFSTFDAGKLIEEAVSFSTRLARVREVSLVLEGAETGPPLCSDPVRIHFLLSILIDLMLEQVGRGGEVVLRAGSEEDGVLIEIEGHGASEATAFSAPHKGNPYQSEMERVVGDLGGSLQTDERARDVSRTALYLPTQQVPNTCQMSSSVQ